MVPLHLFCRVLHRQICVSKVPAAFVTDESLTRLHFFSPSHNISTVNAPIDKDVLYTKNSYNSRRGASVFSAGSSKNRAVRNKNNLSIKKPPTPLNPTYIPIPTEPLGSDGWSKLKDQFNLRGNYEDRVIEQMLKSGTDLKIAKSLLSFVAEKNGDVSYRLLVKYLVLCVQQNQGAEICELYDIMKMKFSYLDTGANSLFIRGLSQTDRWRESIGILEAMRKIGPVSARNFGDCIKVANKHQEVALGWALYDGILQNNMVPPPDAIQSFFDVAQDLQNDDYRKRLISILSYFREIQFYPGEPLMESILSWFESIPGESWRGKITRVTDSTNFKFPAGPAPRRMHTARSHASPASASPLGRRCQPGHHQMDPGQHRWKTPRACEDQELQKFLEFVNSRPPYDIVVDGLNVAYHGKRNILSQALLDVVSYLRGKGRRILVLGRKHMLVPSRKWLKQDIQLLQQYADCFFLDNISLDDPFLLYACLNSGSQCYIMTKDLLRDHKACLPDAETKRLFFKWQRGHQIVIQDYTSKNLRLQPAQSYDTIVQCTDTSYHIPYDKADVERATFEVPKTWLCLKKEK
ncbi:mitochondrial ribonuclease P catalytic subunit [Pyxicephalus adspersus]|uniref:mitochondrial ribonuclease P catalytic subunit n=1 Tax=Pyxicephalus adspersus TaxID=30357 RepID=UPI003B5BF5DA